MPGVAVRGAGLVAVEIRRHRPAGKIAPGAKIELSAKSPDPVACYPRCNAKREPEPHGSLLHARQGRDYQAMNGGLQPASAQTFVLRVSGED